MSRPKRQVSSAPGADGLSDGGWLAKLTTRQLDTDIVVLDDEWLRDSGVQHQLEFDGFQLRWTSTTRVFSNLQDGWLYVTVPYYFWWRRRVRRRHGKETQYLLKRVKSSR